METKVRKYARGKYKKGSHKPSKTAQRIGLMNQLGALWRPLRTLTISYTPLSIYQALKRLEKEDLIEVDRSKGNKQWKIRKKPKHVVTISDTVELETACIYFEK